MIDISPGIISSGCELLEIIKKTEIAFADISRSFGKIGVSSIDHILNLTQYLDWIRINNKGIAKLSPKGERIINTTGDPLRLRQAIVDYVDVAKPSWLQNAPYGRKKLLLYASKNVYQCFLEAELIVATSEEVVKYWDTLSAMARGIQKDALVEIGRKGEKLSIQYEKNRTGVDPKWIALESNQDGYDILSVNDKDNKQKLSIEVKTTKMKSGAFFYISQNEWNWSLESANHIFHLWDISGNGPRLAILTTSQVRPHISINQGTGEWQNVRLPFEGFFEHFKKPPLQR
jgi:hypothetical protein